jgi:hypothetical protein
MIRADHAQTRNEIMMRLFRHDLVAADKPSSAEPTTVISAAISGATESAAVTATAPDESSAPEIGLGDRRLIRGRAVLQALLAQIAKQGVNALVIALNGRVRSV